MTKICFTIRLTISLYVGFFSQQGTYVEGIKEEVVCSPAHALSLIAAGEGTIILQNLLCRHYFLVWFEHHGLD